MCILFLNEAAPAATTPLPHPGALRIYGTAARRGGAGAPPWVVAGKDDILIPPMQSRRIHDRMAGAEWLTVPGGHAACWEFPESFNAVVLDFVGRHRAS